MADKEGIEAASFSEGKGLLSQDPYRLSWEDEKFQTDHKKYSRRWKRWIFPTSILLLTSLLIIGFFLIHSPFKHTQLKHLDEHICE
jgi:hypothetical protein